MSLACTMTTSWGGYRLDEVKEEEMGILSKVNGELKGYLDAHMDEYREYHMERDNDSYD